MQICDVFLPELCKVDDQVSFETISALLRPFLTTLATSPYALFKERIVERVFDSLLESNITIPSDSESSGEEDLTKVDGGKFSRKTRKELKKLINTKYVFCNFNILLYAEN